MYQIRRDFGSLRSKFFIFAFSSKKDVISDIYSSVLNEMESLKYSTQGMAWPAKVANAKGISEIR